MAKNLTPYPKTTQVNLAAVGLGQRLADAGRYLISGIVPTTWMSPQQPIQPQQQDTQMRDFDFPIGSNLSFMPRGEFEDLAPFDLLRWMATLDTTAAIIETRKDQMAQIPWDIVNLDGKPYSGAKKIKDALEYPDGVHPFETFMRTLTHEMLTIDAACVFPSKEKSGTLRRLEVVDGSTIKPLIDAHGRPPLAPEPAYVQVIKGIPANFSRMDELVYFPRVVRSFTPYGFSPVEQIATIINLAIRKQNQLISHVTEGNIPPALIALPSTWTDKQIVAFETWFNSKIGGNDKERKRVQFIPGQPEGAKGGAQVLHLQEPELTGVFEEWTVRVQCFAFSISPTPFIKQVNRATAESARDAATTEGLHPNLAWFRALMNRVLAIGFNAPEARFKFLLDETEDILKEEQALDIAVKGGRLSIDDARKKRGYDGVGSTKLFVWLPTGPIPVPLDNDPSTQPRGAGVVPDPPPALTPHVPEAGAAPAKPQGQAQAKPEVKEPVEKAAPANFEEGGLVEQQATAIGAALEKAAKPRRTLHRQRHPELQAHIANLQKPIATFLKAQARKAAKKAARAVRSLEKADGGKGIVKDLDLAWDNLTALFKKRLSIVAADASTRAVVQLDLAGKEEDIVKLANERAEAWAAEHAAELVTGLEDATRDMLVGDISTAIEEGWGAQQLADTLEENYAFSENRALAIAQTELAFADSNGTLIGWKETGVVKGKQWMLAPDHSDDDDCDANAAQGEIGINEAFSSGDPCPPAHTNCHCDMMAVLEDATPEA